MAEILLSLTIIGVVAAITLPSLTGNINERTWNTQRKALYARMSQAIPLMGSLNGYGIGATESETASNAAKTFITNGLAKVYKINNICDAEHLDDCGIPDKITVKAGNKVSVPGNLYNFNSNFNRYPIQMNTSAAAFETANGESVLAFYNPLCTSFEPNGTHNLNVAIKYSSQITGANFIYDLNGKKGPNTVGKDIGFIIAINSTDSNVVSFLPKGVLPANTYTALNSACRQTYHNDEDVRAITLYDAVALWSNQFFILETLSQTGAYQTTTTNAEIGKNYYIDMYRGGALWIPTSASSTRQSYCVQK